VVDRVTKSFAGLKALSDVSLSVAPGEVVGLMGPNGSGKSTLVNVVSGILKPDSGTVRVDGEDVTRASSGHIARAGVSRSFQTVRLFQALTVRDNIAAVVRSPAAPVDEVAGQLMDRLRIGHLGDVRAGELAYGLQRRVEVARALATDPRYLLLDEPAAGLNDVETDELQQIIREATSPEVFGCGVLVIDHDMHMITTLCDRLHVLASGRTIAEGQPAEVREHPEVITAYLGTGRR
jgi:branched-chain amino acid transport system ATP-binding protein